MKLSLCAYDTLNQLSTLRPAWDELLSNYPPASTFSTWEWLSAWWEAFGHGRQLLVLALFDSESLVGLAPLAISRERVGGFSLRVLRLMGDGSADSDNLDLPVRPSYEEAFIDAVIQYLRQHRSQWDVCLLNTLPTNSSVIPFLAKQLETSSWTCFQYSTRSSAISLPETWELYTQALSSEDRKNLVRYTRRLQSRYSSRIYRCRQADELRACLDALFRLHQGRWEGAGQAGSFASAQRREFYAKLSPALLSCNWLELWVLELDGQIAAVQYAFRYGDKVFQLQEGYDHTRTSDRLGYVLRGHVLQQLIAEKVRTYDFLGGEDSYKARWGAREGHYRQLHFAPAFGLGATWLRWIDTRNKSKEWLRRRAPASIWSWLHKANLAVRKREFERARS